MTITDEIISKLENIWNEKKYADFCKYTYLFPEIEQNKDLLFVGINPSYREEHLIHQSYTVDERINTLPYFNAFNNFSNELNATWTHIDLLFFRETNQKKIHDILTEENGAAFIYEQLKVADSLIKYANPKVIIVCNALARLFLGKEKEIDKKTGKEVNVWLDYKLKFNEEIGTYFWNETPVFFSSMLSGQRALDKGSLERLQWQVKRVLKISNNKYI